MNNFISFITITIVSFYSLSIMGINGKMIEFNQFRGKKILIVNTATNSRYNSQIDNLEVLYQKYKTTLVILAVPTNNFQHENGSNTEIEQKMISGYHPTFDISSLTNVQGANQSPLYSWLSSSALNGQLDNLVPSDFTKYLINEDGTLVAVFGGSVDPMDSVVQNALKN